MKLRQFEILRAVAKAGSFRAAEEHLNTSQPAMTRMVQQLEEELGLQLLHRSIKGVQLTEAGKLVMRHSSSVFAQLGYLRDEVEALKNNTREQLSISVAPAISLSILPAAVRRFLRHFPDVHLNVSGTLLPAALDELLDGTLDCILGSATQEVFERANVRPLLEVDIVVIAAADNPVSGLERVSLADLRDARWFVAGGSENLSRYFGNAGLEAPKAFVTCDSLTAMIALVAGGTGLGLAPAPYTSSGFFPSVKVVRIVEPLDPRKIQLVTRKNAEHKRSLRYLISCFEALAREEGQGSGALTGHPAGDRPRA